MFKFLNKYGIAIIVNHGSGDRNSIDLLVLNESVLMKAFFYVIIFILLYAGGCFWLFNGHDIIAIVSWVLSIIYVVTICSVDYEKL